MEVDVYVKKMFDSTVSGKVWVGALRTDDSQMHVKAEAAVQMKF